MIGAITHCLATCKVFGTAVGSGLASQAFAVQSFAVQSDDMPAPIDPDHFRQKLVAILLSVAMTVVVLELVRKRKLREEYALLWILTGLVLLALAIQSDLLNWFQQLVGAAYPTSALFFGGLVFLMLVALQVSVRLSKLTFRNKSLTQRVALLERELADLRAAVDERRGSDQGAA